MRKALLLFVALLLANIGFAQQRYIQLIYTSDSHYGIERTFRGKQNVSASKVNRAMVEEMNRIASLVLPADGGVKSGEKMGWVDYVINTGDIANRAEKEIQVSEKSWLQFERDWNRLRLKNANGEKAPLLLLPGNHDISNAVGHPQIPEQKVDASSAAAIFNAMLKPARPVNKDNYIRDVNICSYSFELSGVHFSFIDMWPDGRNRQWLADDLKQLPDSIVCLVFTHDQPNIEARHLINPNGKHDINAGDKFENLVADTSSVKSAAEIPVNEHRQLAAFIKAHPAIKAYFHGNENYNEFYTWRGADNDIALPVFRVDSPMKGINSSEDETLLSFQLIVIDTIEKRMTVREYFWNKPGGMLWGETVTVAL